MGKTNYFFTFYFALIFSVGALSVASADISEKDVQEINQYRLTGKAMGQFGQSTKNLIELSQTKPDIFKDARKNKIAEEDFAGLIDAYEKIPGVKNAIEKSGMSVHDYVYFEFAMVYGETGNLVLKSGGTLPEGFSKENVAFYRSHEADFKKLVADLKTFGDFAKGKSSDSSEDDEETDDEP